MSEQSDTKSMAVAYILWFFLGAFGGHRFYMGRKGSAFGMLGLCLGSIVLTAVLVGILGFIALFVWAIVDAFLIPKWMQECTPVVSTMEQPPMREAA